MDKTEILLEEYKYLCQEKERYYKERDYSTIATLTIGIPLIGFGIKEGTAIDNLIMLSIYFVIPLILFLYLFVRFYWTELLGLKADAFIRYKIEKEIPDLNWFTKKASFNLGKTRKLHKAILNFTYLAFIGADLWLIFKNNKFVFLISLIISLFVIVTTLILKEKMDDKEMMKNWTKRFNEDE
jgi:hypothetical protein